MRANREELAGLTDPNAVHINMLRGGIAKPTPTQIGHLYRGDQAVEVVREVIRQNPGAAAALRQSPSVEEVARAVMDATPTIKGGWDAAYKIAERVADLFQGRGGG